MTTVRGGIVVERYFEIFESERGTPQVDRSGGQTVLCDSDGSFKQQAA